MSTAPVLAWPAFSSRLVGSWRVADQTMAFRFERPAGWAFKAGQFVDLTLLTPHETDAEGNVRGFSLASAPDERTLMVATRMRDTVFKRNLAAALPDTEFKIQGPFGDFTLHRDAQRPAVMIAGGIGITPFRSMVLSAAHSRLNHQIVLLYFNRCPEDAPFLEELRHLESRDPKCRLIAVMTQPERSRRGWSGENGHLDAAMLERHVQNLKKPIFYVAGPSLMVAGIRQVLNAAGVDNDDVRTEEFAGY